MSPTLLPLLIVPLVVGVGPTDPWGTDAADPGDVDMVGTPLDEPDTKRLAETKLNAAFRTPTI